MNSFGRLFRVSIFGESHGPAVGIIIDGCPAGIDLAPEDFTTDIERRKGVPRKALHHARKPTSLFFKVVFSRARLPVHP